MYTVDLVHNYGNFDEESERVSAFQTKGEALDFCNLQYDMFIHEDDESTGITFLNNGSSTWAMVTEAPVSSTHSLCPVRPVSHVEVSNVSGQCIICGSELVRLPDHVSEGTAIDIKYDWPEIVRQTEKNGCYEYQSEDSVWFKFVSGERVIPVDFNK